MSTTSPNPLALEIGRDYVGALTGLAFRGVPGDASVAVAWTLYDATNTSLGTGTGTYLSPGLYEFIVAASLFDAQAPYPSQFKTGRIQVDVTRSGVRGSFGERVYFVYPDDVAA